MIGRSVKMRELFARLEKLARTDTTVLSPARPAPARSWSPRRCTITRRATKGPFVVLDCGAIPPNLIESELFGHERGAFTGATAATPGAFERAHGGTVFLDEIGELPLELQPKLLRVLERKEVRRVGGAKTIEVDVRIVAATNRDLGVEVNRGRFREDLYYRLAVARVHVPPLREREDDLPLLVEHILATTPRRRGRVDRARDDRPDDEARLARQRARAAQRDRARRAARRDARQRGLAAPRARPAPRTEPSITVDAVADRDLGRRLDDRARRRRASRSSTPSRT